MPPQPQRRTVSRKAQRADSQTLPPSTGWGSKRRQQPASTRGRGQGRQQTTSARGWGQRRQQPAPTRGRGQRRQQPAPTRGRGQRRQHPVPITASLPPPSPDPSLPANPLLEVLAQLRQISQHQQNCLAETAALRKQIEVLQRQVNALPARLGDGVGSVEVKVTEAEETRDTSTRLRGCEARWGSQLAACFTEPSQSSPARVETECEAASTESEVKLEFDVAEEDPLESWPEEEEDFHGESPRLNNGLNRADDALHDITSTSAQHQVDSDNSFSGEAQTSGNNVESVLGTFEEAAVAAQSNGENQFKAGPSRASSKDAVHFYQCEDCGLVLAHATSLRRHKGRKHGHGQTHKCRECDKQYSERKNLLSHVALVHMKVKPHRCAQCGKEFGHHRSAKQHRCRPVSQPLICALCGKQFALGKYLRQHLRSHDASPTFLCRQCGCKFKHHSSLARHENLCQSKEVKD